MLCSHEKDAKAMRKNLPNHAARCHQERRDGASGDHPDRAVVRKGHCGHRRQQRDDGREQRDDPNMGST
jgi:hypothetical protein